jgi:hypothetical protein
VTKGFRRWVPRARTLIIVCAVALVPLFLWRSGLGAIRSELARLGPESVLILLPYACGTALSGLPWAHLFAKSSAPSLREAIVSRFAASGANSLVPFLGVAGEASRLLWLPPVARAEGTAALAMDRLLYNFAGGLLLLAGAAVAFTTRLDRWICLLATATAAALLGLVVLAFLLLSRYGLGGRGQRWLRRLAGSAQGEGDFGADVDAALRALCRQRRRLLGALSIHLLARAVTSLEAYVALWSLHAPTSFRDATVLATVPVATAFLAFTIPSQVGVQEGTQALITAALGHGPALGLVLVLLQRGRQLVFVPLTPFLIALARPRHAKSRASSVHQYGQ